MIGLFGNIVGVLLKSTSGKVVSVLSILLIFGTYISWYYEKFKWLEVNGLKEGTVEYSKVFNQIGWFRGANEFDYIVLFSVIVLFIWIIFRYRIKELKFFQ